MADSIFTKIINREVPGHIVYEDDICVAILDIFPTVKGQSLVVPKEQIAYAFDLKDETYTHIFKVAKKIARASDAAFNTAKTCLVVEGFDVPHVHIKLYPLQDSDRPLGEKIHLGEEANKEELALTATQLQAAIEEEE